ncbi:glutamine--fructose-6-phosphate transaminase (isomerizing) [Candidatus Gracilibacteria bacterium]|nr:glutamine--fructose-6-phosphate transaminase (isomerizing) [Candidatus Gracilibacteria bacterium]
MCGIFAYVGTEDCRKNLVEGLRMLEYRGYDSAGLICVGEEKEIFLEKAVGRVSALASKVDEKIEKEKNEQSGLFTSGIAHTRWATHGGVTESNTHPHYSGSQRFYIVHNGIIENYKELKKSLETKYTYYSETDTEVVAKLIEDMYDGNLKSTIEKVSEKLTGAYSLAVIDVQHPEHIIAIKLGSPLIVGKGENGVYLSSDINALSQLTESFTILEDNEMVVIESKKYHIYMAGERVQREAEEVGEVSSMSELGDFSSFTEKEIFEIPSILENVFSGRINFEEKIIHNETLEVLAEEEIEKICIIASGSSSFAGGVGGYFFRKYAGVPCETIISSEFLADIFLPEKKTLYVFLSQSGETADVRESMKIVKAKGCKTFGIVNVVGSTIARMSDAGLFSHAGIEVGVASTKNVIAQVGVLLLMALSFGSKRNLQISEIRDIITELASLPDKIQEVCLKAPHIRKLSEKYAHYKHFFVLGRNMMYPVALEASLKIKELSYVHSEAYSAGELKHGPLALVSPEFPTIVFNPSGKHYHKTISNIEEVRAREGKILGFISKNDTHKEVYTDCIELPDTSELLSVFTSLTASYLFALYLAEKLGRDVDKPRNLAKSVTVE